MKKSKKNLSYVKKIEVDEKTHEPIIVEVPESEYLNGPIEKADFVEMKSDKSVGKQMAMERVLGIKKQDDSIDKRQKTFKTITTILFLVFVVGVLAFTAYKDFFGNDSPPNWQVISGKIASSWYFLIFALLALFFGFFFKGLKNVIMCKSMTGKAHFLTCIETGIIGTYYNNVTPLAVGGQPFEIYHLSKHGVHGGVASSIPIASFFLNQLAFVILGVISLIIFNTNALGAPSILMNAFPPAYNVLAIVGLFCCIFVPFLVVLFSMLPRVGARMVHFVIKLGTKLHIIRNPKETAQKTIKTVVHNSHCLKKLATSPLVFCLTFLLSFLENFSNASIAFFTLKAFGLIDMGSFINEWLIVVMMCFILFASVTFIPTPGNSGAADLSFFLLFEAVLVSGLAFPAMVVWRLLSFYSTIIIGFLFATFKKKSDLKKQKLAPAEQEPDQPTESTQEEDPLVIELTELGNKEKEE